MRQGDTPKRGHPKAAACLRRAALPAPWVPAPQPVFARPRLDLVTPSTCPGAPRSVCGALGSGQASSPPCPHPGGPAWRVGGSGEPPGPWVNVGPVCSRGCGCGAEGPVSYEASPLAPAVGQPSPPPKEGLALLAPLGRVGAAMPHRCRQSLVLWHGQRLCLLLCQGPVDRAPPPPPNW